MSLVYGYDKPLDLPVREVRLLLGGKAANLAEMASTLGLPVPPGFTITTTACKDFLARGWPTGLDAEIRAAMADVERQVGHRFGDPADPLLVSVRSGAPVSMPGMMDTILDLGLNEATTGGLATATGDPEFAADCRARFEQMFRSVVGVAEAPDDPWRQLRVAIEAVFRSWNSDRACAYRRREGIADDLGTAVTIQAMVYGNRGDDSATGVLFTRDPATGVPALYGDLLFHAQGEDVVAGTHRTLPIAALDERLPAVGAELRRAAATLERHFADMCDIEFTIERGRLWLLQVRVGKRSPQAALRMAVDMADDPAFPLSRAEAVRRVAPLLADPPMTTARVAGGPAPLAIGLPASPGVATGVIATTCEAAVAAADAGRPVILCRAETSPDDVHGMTRSVGILTARGGLVSHAAVVARSWGIPAIVGATALTVHDGTIEIAGHELASGDEITIDGGTGEVFEGCVARSVRPAPEVATLLGWAAQLGIDVDAAAKGEVGIAPAAEAYPGVSPIPAAIATEPGQPAMPAAAATREDVIRALLIKGLVTTDQLAPAVGVTPDAVGPIVDELVEAGLAERLAGAARLTAAGKDHGHGLLEAEREQWGEADANAALDAFVALDRRIKETVTAWQLKPGDGEPTLNDHSDPAYDARVLRDLAAIHDEASGWLGPLTARLPRLSTYADRLGRALASARDGDGRFIASPRVDSYHGVWFELHEELILLAGRTRAAETAAGRA